MNTLPETVLTPTAAVDTVETPPARQEQLRLAKRRQREREKQRGLAVYQLRLPRNLAEKLKEGNRHTDFMGALHALIDRQIIHIDDYENLRMLTWNRAIRFTTRADAFRLYEDNWRHVDTKTMGAGERELIRDLAQEFGNGIIHA